MISRNRLKRPEPDRPRGLSDPAASLTSPYMTRAQDRIDALVDEFDLLEDWEERYRYVIELGRELEPLSEAEHDEANRVHGCASQVWLVTERGAEPGTLRFRGDSDAHIVRGLIAILLRLYNDLPPEEIAATDTRDAFRQIGLSEHLSRQRSNGVVAMTERIQGEAEAAAAPSAV